MEQFTTLKDRVLWYDGTTQVKPEDAVAWLERVGLENLAVTEVTPEIKNFNKLSTVKLSVKEQNRELSLAWFDEFADIDTLAALERLCEQEPSWAGINRLCTEYELFLKHGLEPLLKLTIYIIQRFKENNIVWGVGRGSSCSLYLLYRLGLHSVDALKYDIPYTEFFKQETV